MDEPLVSVIIPAMNSEATIRQCIQSIKNQSYPNIEIIIVDNFSSDNTRAIARQLGVGLYISPARRAQARNFGVNRAKGDFVLSVDSDMELTPRVVQDCVEKVEEGYAAIMIPEASVGIGFWADCKTLEKSCYVGDDVIEAPRFFNKSILEGLGGYDPMLEAGEDWDISQRIRKAGHRIARVNSFINHDEGRLTLKKTMKKKHRYGKTLKRYERKHPIIAKQQLRLIRPALVKNWRKLAKDPAHALGIVFLKTCELMAAKIGAVG